MSARTYTAGAAVHEWRGGARTGERAYGVWSLPVHSSDGGTSRLEFTERRGRWVASWASRTFTDDGREWSAWSAVVHLAMAGVLDTHNHGPNTYGHTDYMLPASMVRRAAGMVAP